MRKLTLNKEKHVLAFERLEQEMEAICKEEQVRLIGGSGGYTWQQLADAVNSGNFNSVPSGSYLVNTDGSVTIYLGPLEDVPINAIRIGGHSSRGYSSNGYSWGEFTEYFNDPYFMNSPFGSSGHFGSSGYVPWWIGGGNSGGGSVGGGSSLGSESIISGGLGYIQSFIDRELPYAQQYGDLRTANTPEALAYMDCSELVCRYLANIEFTDGVVSMNCAALKSYSLNNPDKLQKVDVPQAGDIFLWNRSPTDGHTGIVKSYDPITEMVTILEEYSYGDVHNAREMTVSKESYTLELHPNWFGFLRPNLGQ